MTTTIKLELEEDLSPEEKAWVRIVLMSALYEYDGARHHGAASLEDARAYVDQRYPEGKDYAWLDRDEKTRYVHAACKLALKMHGATFRVEVDTLRDRLRREGKCECATYEKHCPNCVEKPNAARHEVTRNGERIRVCWDCTLSGDTDRVDLEVSK